MQSSRAMASGSSSTCTAVHRRGPFVPTIPCPDCHKLVTRNVSRTEKHDGWTYYKFKTHGHGCNFWHWELEYVGYLLENDILFGDCVVEAIGWSEERREELELQKAEKEAVGDGIAHDNNNNNNNNKKKKKKKKLKEQQLLTNTEAIVDSLKKVQIFLVMIVALLFLMYGMLLVKKSKSM